MESHFIALVFLVIAVTIQKSDGHELMKCAGQDLKNPKMDLFHNMKACTDELKAAAGDKAEFKRGGDCITTCALKKDGIFDATGMFNATAYKATLIATLPTEDLVKQMVTAVDECMAKIKKDIKEDEKDYHCASHHGLICCIMMAWKKICMKDYHAVMDEACH